MLEAILSTLSIMGWLGIILGILVIVNTICGTIYNICSGKEKFKWGKLFKGLGKAIIFYISAAFLTIALTMLPFINDMMANAFSTVLISTELLNTLSSVGVLSVVVSVIVVQAKKAVQGIMNLANINIDTKVTTNKKEEE